MKTSERAIEILKRLSEDKIQTALYFLELLALKEEVEATEEILGDRELTEMIKHSRMAKREKRKEEFVSWEALQDV